MSWGGSIHPKLRCFFFFLFLSPFEIRGQQVALRSVDTVPEWAMLWKESCGLYTNQPEMSTRRAPPLSHLWLPSVQRQLNEGRHGRISKAHWASPFLEHGVALVIDWLIQGRAFTALCEVCKTEYSSLVWLLSFSGWIQTLRYRARFVLFVCVCVGQIRVAGMLEF